MLRKPSLAHTCKARWNAFSVMTAGVLMISFCSLFVTNSAYGIATASTLTLTVDDHDLAATASPGVLGLSEPTNISVVTDNFTGYTLKVNAVNTTNLVSTNNDTIPSINSTISQSTYQSGSQYKL